MSRPMLTPAETVRAILVAGLALALWTGATTVPAAAEEASCTYDGRVVPHGTQIGVLRCDDGRWVRVGR
jgi:hypothetical protein